MSWVITEWINVKKPNFPSILQHPWPQSRPTSSFGLRGHLDVYVTSSRLIFATHTKCAELQVLVR